MFGLNILLYWLFTKIMKTYSCFMIVRFIRFSFNNKRFNDWLCLVFPSLNILLFWFCLNLLKKLLGLSFSWFSCSGSIFVFFVFSHNKETCVFDDILIWFVINLLESNLYHAVFDTDEDLQPRFIPQSLSCQMYDSRLATEGDTWDVNPCLSCTCHSGYLLCTSTQCPLVTCENPYYDNNTCCQVCPGKIK